ncbi:MAG: glycosyltransferase family 92 protein [Waddliaceae bacterium]
MRHALKILAISLLLFANAFAKHQLSICAIFQNEAPYFKEWIEFHKLQGVEHFYLYNNNSSDAYKKLLLPYLHSKIVTLIEWPYTYEQGNTKEWIKIQRSAYLHCLKKYGARTKWLAAIDADEFLFCPNGELLTSFLKRYQQYGGVCANWLLFGTSHIEQVPPQTLMIEMLTMCSAPNNPRNVRVKSIVQPKCVKDCDTAHSFVYKEGFFAVGADGNKIVGGNSPYVSHDKIRINHYWTRTEKHFREKKIKSRHNRRLGENETNLTAMANAYNVNNDSAILQFVPALRKKMGYD